MRWRRPTSGYGEFHGVLNEIHRLFGEYPSAGAEEKITDREGAYPARFLRPLSRMTLYSSQFSDRSKTVQCRILSLTLTGCPPDDGLLCIKFHLDLDRLPLEHVCTETDMLELNLRFA